MRTAIAMAAAIAVGGTAAAAGATGLAVPAKWYGSDTLQVITWDMLGGQLVGYTGAGDTDLASGQSAQYLAGGSGAGQAAMSNSVGLSASLEQAAPMSKLMTSGICGTSSAPIYGVGNGTSAQNASGIVIAMDAVSMYASNTSGAASACTTPGSAGDGQTSDGLAGSGSPASVFAGGNTNQNWKWVLALLYGGVDLSAAAGTIPDCNSTARQNLVAHWSQLFQNGCTNGNSVCTNSAHTALGQSGSTPLWHAFRRDDASGTSDVFSNVIGIQAFYPSPSATGNKGFGASPFCNALNWDTSPSNASCGLNVTSGAVDINDQFVGPGGVIDPASQWTFTNLSTTEVQGAAGSGNHRRPPPGTYGDAPNASGVGADVLPTSFQDNDPIRRPCLGNTTGNQFKSGEEVCNTDNKLGVLLAIPASDWITRTQVNGVQLVQYSTNACNSFGISAPPRIFNCPISNTGVHGGECPNGDSQFAGGCLAPVDTVHNTSMCLNPRGNFTVLVARSNLQPSYDARRHNLFMLDGDMNTTIQPMKESLANGTASPPNVDFFAGMARIHSTQAIWDTTIAANNTSPPAVGCTMKDATDEIACLTQADPCSVGYAGAGGLSWYSHRGPDDGNTAALCASLTAGGATTLPAACNASSPLVSDAVRVDGTYPTADNVQALGTQANEYQISRKLYYNSIGGFANITTTTADPGGAGELDFGAWESIASNTQPILASIGYFQLSPSQAPNGTELTTGYTKPFCEDFNQNMLCKDHPTNDNACVRNGGSAVTVPNYPTTASAALGYTSALPGESGSDPVNNPVNSTVCGNGKKEMYEECDDGASNGLATDKCNNICRCNGTFSYKLVGGVWGCN